MTVEELQAKLDEAQAEIASVKSEKESLVKNQSNQNAYITKLEEKANGFAAQIASIKDAASKPALDPQITAYFKKKYVEDFVDEGKEVIKARDTKNQFSLLEKDLDAFLKQYMNETNASIKFIVDSYYLILGRAIGDPTHPINKVVDEGAKSNAQPQPQSMFIKPEVPPMLTNEDLGAGNPAAKKSIEVQDTKSAFKVLEDRLFNAGQNKFE